MFVMCGLLGQGVGKHVFISKLEVVDGGKGYLVIQIIELSRNTLDFYVKNTRKY